MTPRITLITAVAAAALVFAVPAAFADPWGADRQAQPDFWNYDASGRQTSNTSPGVAPENLAGLFATTTGDTSTMLDARERALVETHGGTSGTQVAVMLDARERSLVETHGVTPGTQIAVTERPYVGDGGDRFTIVPTSTPVSVGAIDSGRDLEWPQIGFGVAIGVLFGLGLMLMLRTTRRRELAH